MVKSANLLLYPYRLYNQSMQETELEIIRTWLLTGSINIFGRPFSGKDTQARILSNVFNAPIIGGGDIIRASTHEQIKSHIATGKLAPQKEYLAMVLPYLKRVEYSDRPLIFSSLGRWHGEEEPICKSATEASHPLKAVIHLNISEEEVIARWRNAIKLGDRGNRDDDNQDSINVRLSEFKSKTLPVINYYKKRNLLIEVDGSQEKSKVTSDILNKLQEFSTK